MTQHSEMNLTQLSAEIHKTLVERIEWFKLKPAGTEPLAK